MKLVPTHVVSCLAGVVIGAAAPYLMGMQASTEGEAVAAPAAPTLTSEQADVLRHMSLVEVETDLLQHGLGVGIENRVLPALDQVVVQIAGVGHVKIAQHHEGLRRPVASPANVRPAEC